MPAQIPLTVFRLKWMYGTNMYWQSGIFRLMWILMIGRLQILFAVFNILELKVWMGILIEESEH